MILLSVYVLLTVILMLKDRDEFTSNQYISDIFKHVNLAVIHNFVDKVTVAKSHNITLVFDR